MAPSNEFDSLMNTEKFAIYGFEIKIPSDWRVEINPKTTREHGDVAFHSKKGNRIFVSWGALEGATKRFKSLEAQRDSSIERIRKGPDVTGVEVSDLRETLIGGHRALISHVKASLKSGFMSKTVQQREVWSLHTHCPNISRFYVVYSMTRDPLEFENFPSVFNNVSGSLVCHTTSTNSGVFGNS